MEEDILKLYGMLSSPYCKRVEMALKIKGIPYEYAHEALNYKSQLVLVCNPVVTKVPVLLHNGRPIVDSTVILEYIDENWSNPPQLLPDDPSQRAKLLFWVNFLDQQLLRSLISVVKSDGEEQEKAVRQTHGCLEVLEEKMIGKDFFPRSNPSLDGRDMGLLDIILSSVLVSYKAFEEATGSIIIDPQSKPLTFSWVTALNSHPVIQETLPPHDKLVELLRLFRARSLNHP